MVTFLRAQRVNPRLGIYNGIITSVIFALFLMLLVLEQLGVSDVFIRSSVLIGVLVLFIVVGSLTTTYQAADFYAAGRRVPAVSSGLLVALTVIGGTGLMAWTGAFYRNGFDALCIVSGVIAGFMIMGMAIGPYFRKAGAYTVPSFLARRFQSLFLRFAAALACVVPLVILLISEMTTMLWAAELLIGPQSSVLAIGFGVTIMSAIVLGGMRGVTWVGTAQAIMALFAIIVLAGIVGVMLTNFPVAQLSFGPVLRGIGRLEHLQNIPVEQVAPLVFNMAGTGFEPLTTRAAEPFSTIGAASYTLATICIAAGVAGAPWLLPRSGTTTSVYEARKSIGWAVFFFGLVVTSLAAIAIFVRHFAMLDLIGQTPSSLPAWLTALRELGLADVAKQVSRISLSDFSIKRDAVLVTLPLAIGAPPIVLYLVLAGIMAIGLAAASAIGQAIAAILSEDVINGLHWVPPSNTYRVAVNRIVSGFIVLAGFALALFIDIDPLRLFFWAMGLIGASLFPVIILSVWWKRLTPQGAVASIFVGLVLSSVAIITAQQGIFVIPSELAGTVGIVPAFAAGILVSNFTAVPTREVLEQIRDMRVPGGETVYDREMRLVQQRQLQRQQ